MCVALGEIRVYTKQSSCDKLWAFTKVGSEVTTQANILQQSISAIFCSILNYYQLCLS
jgi:hypothetical protein